MVARLLTILSLVAALALPASANEEDVGFLTRTLQDALSDAGRDVRIVGFEGALSSRATIREMTIADEDGVWLTLRGAVLDWNRAALLRRQLEVNELSAEEIVFERAPDTGPSRPSPEAQTFGLPELPVSLRVGRLVAERVVLGEALFGAEAVVRLAGSAQLAGGEGSASFEIVRTDGPEGALRMEGEFSNVTRVLALDMSVSEDADGIAANLIGLPGTPAIDLSIAGQGPLDDFVADIRLATDGIERLAGQVVLLSEPTGEDGAENTRRFRADLGGDIAPLFAPEFRDFFGDDIRLAAEGARYPDGRMELSTLDLRANAVTLSGEVAIGADGLPELIVLEGGIAAPDGAPVLLPIAGPRTRIDSARLALDFDARRGEDWQAEISLAGLSRPDLWIAQVWLSGEGRITAGAAGAGVAAQFRFAAEGLAPEDPGLARALGSNVTGHARIDWVQGGDIDLAAFGLSGSDYGLSGAASLRGQRLAGQVEARAGSLERFSGLAGRPLSGALTGRLSGEAQLLSGAFDIEAALSGRDLRLDQDEFDRLLAGTSRIETALRRDETGTHVDRLEVGAQTLTANLSGFISTARSNLSGRIDFSDLSVLGAGYGGALAAEGRFDEAEGVQRLSFDATGQDLAAGQAELDRLLSGESRLALRAERIGRVIEVEDFSLRASTLVAQISGRIEEGASDLSARLDFTDLGTLGERFGGQLEADARLREEGPRRRLTLDAQGTDLALGIAEVDRILRGASRLSLDGHQEGELLRLDAFSLTAPLLTADASATVEGETRLLDLSVRLADLGVIVPQFPGPVTFAGRITEGPDSGYLVDVSGTGPGNIDARISGSMARDLTSNLSITGTANLALSNPFHEPINVQGLARYDLRLVGRPGLDALSGTVSTTDARIVAPQQYVTLEGVSATGTLGGGQVRVEAEGNVQGGGRLGLSGTVGLVPGVLPADLSVSLQRARVTDRRIFETRISGNLAITGALLGSRGRITGALSLEDTEIRIPSSGLGAGEYIPPLVHVNESAESLATRRAARLNNGAVDPNGRVPNAFALDLTLSSPNRVFIRGRGLDAELGGNLRLTGTTLDVVPAGEFTLLRGRLDILGRRFALSDGLARLQGRFIPFVRLTATTSTDGITASIVLEGEADRLQIRFLSVPELPEEEIVARLLFGRELGRLSPFQAAQLASAVATLAGRGGEGVVGNLRRSFGLDDLDVSTGENGLAAVRLGRYLSENIYTNVIVDAEGRSEVSINLDVSRSVTVRGRTDSEGRSGVGIFFERDY